MINMKKRNFNRSLDSYKKNQAYKAKKAQAELDGFSFNEDPGVLIREYRHWVIRENRFPYDAIFDKHHMLIPKRTFSHSRNMTENERREFEKILDEISEEYDGVLENFNHARSVPAHFHPHLFRYKKIDIEE